jgi:DNA-directed RNA polymerase specialized sigma24 family protein
VSGRPSLPIIRVAGQARLTAPALQRVFDTGDICQSVLCSLFVRLAAGEYDLQEPGQLVGLLVRMARNKLASRVRQEQSQRRGGHLQAVDPGVLATQAGGLPVDVVASWREIFQELLKRFDRDERELAERRSAGESWEAIALALGGTPEARRKQLRRAVRRFAAQMGLEDLDG